MVKINSFRDLEAWQKSYNLAVNVLKVAKSFPQEEQFGLASQLRRSAVSVPSNIAEGFHRQTQKEKIQFYHIASGSVAELETQLLISVDVDYINPDKFKALIDEAAQSHKLIYGLIRSTRSWEKT